jgi:hypothetical protein
VVEAVDVHPIRRKLAPGALAVGEDLPETFRAGGAPGEAATHAHDGDGAREVGLHGASFVLLGRTGRAGASFSFSTRLVSARGDVYLAANLDIMYAGRHDRSAIQARFRTSLGFV